MRFFYDTEFIEDGSVVELVSIGIVSETGAEYYACSTDFNPRSANSWVRDNVLNQLPGPASDCWKPRSTIRDEVAAFLLEGHSRSSRPELWAWVGCYDHVVYAQLFGDMGSMPQHLPRFTREIKQYWEMAGRPKLPAAPQGQHDALVDARHNRERFAAIHAVAPLDKRGALVNRSRSTPAPGTVTG
ncbi:polyadenylate-specific 3'-exoribonuclease AS [Corynebacterium mendelii]|uniref:3'-5' exoribonuclease n=1 Tax=Corynebacterium mendelii TaxID=2765362 RepID=A0A939DZQ1_9CORY|nr:polyadenylate-specific 3'-exoribonuclease AS [Corynebacterium mendelii]